MAKEEAPQATSSTTYLVIGVILLVILVGLGMVLRSKKSAPTSVTAPVPVVLPTPTPGPITGLGCDTLYYNPKIGFAEYYLSAEGGDLPPAKEVDCTFTASASGKVVAKTSVTSPLTDSPQRGGKTFRCSTKALALEPNVPTTVDVVFKDDQKQSASCSATFLLPTP